MSKIKLEASPLPWTMNIVGRDTPNGVTSLRDAQGYSVVKADAAVRRDDALFILSAIADAALTADAMTALKEVLEIASGLEEFFDGAEGTDVRMRAEAVLAKWGQVKP